MNKVILIILLGVLVLSCDFKKKTPAKITNAFLSEKEFITDRKAIMGSKHFEFTGTTEVSYTINDKTAYGYDGTYEFEYDDQDNQFIKITGDKGKLTVILFVKSPTELEIVSSEPAVYPDTVFPFIQHRKGKIYELYVPKTEE